MHCFVALKFYSMVLHCMHCVFLHVYDASLWASITYRHWVCVGVSYLRFGSPHCSSFVSVGIFQDDHPLRLGSAALGCVIASNSAGECHERADQSFRALPICVGLWMCSQPASWSELAVEEKALTVCSWGYGDLCRSEHDSLRDLMVVWCGSCHKTSGSCDVAFCCWCVGV